MPDVDPAVAEPVLVIGKIPLVIFFINLAEFPVRFFQTQSRLVINPRFKFIQQGARHNGIHRISHILQLGVSRQLSKQAVLVVEH